MKNWTKIALTGASSSALIHITSTTTGSAHVIHTAGPSEIDEVYIWAQNQHTIDVQLNLEWEGATDPADFLRINVPFKEPPLLIVPGWPLSDSKDIQAWASVTAVLNIFGYVHRAA